MDLNITSNKFTANYLPPCIDTLKFSGEPALWIPVNFHLCNITVSLYLLKAPNIVAEGEDYKIISSHYKQVDHVVRSI